MTELGRRIHMLSHIALHLRTVKPFITSCHYIIYDSFLCWYPKFVYQHHETIVLERKLITSFPKCLLQLFVDIGSHKLENEHADFALSTLHILQSSLSAVQLFKVRISTITGLYSLLKFSILLFFNLLLNLFSCCLYYFCQYHPEERLENGLLSLQLY